MSGGLTFHFFPLRFSGTFWNQFTGAAFIIWRSHRSGERSRGLSQSRFGQQLRGWEVLEPNRMVSEDLVELVTAIRYIYI